MYSPAQTDPTSATAWERMAGHPDWVAYSAAPNWLICACVTAISQPDQAARIRRSGASCGRARAGTSATDCGRGRRDVRAGPLGKLRSGIVRRLLADSATAPESRSVRQLPIGAASSAARICGSAPPISTILVRLDAPATSRTALRRTPNAPATAASAASVALPSTARALTRTTRAPARSPPTPGRAEPGLTQMAIRMQPVSRAAPAAARGRAPPADDPPDRYPPDGRHRPGDRPSVEVCLTGGSARCG